MTSTNVTPHASSLRAKYSTILQWNIRGAHSNLQELQLIVENYNPTALCLQETMQKDSNIITLRRYDHFFLNSTARDGRASGGVSLFVLKTLPHSQIDLVGNIQAVAVRLSLHKPITLCSLYLPPSSPLCSTELDDLIAQLPTPVLLLGDFNSHSTLWGCGSLNTRGKIIEDFINNNNLCLLNNKSYTYLHPATGSLTAIDLTLCDPSTMMDYSWSVLSDLCGSDHYPIVISNNIPIATPTAQTFKLNKADWSSFESICEDSLLEEKITNSVDPVGTFSIALLDAAKKSIPRSSLSTKTIRKPWFNSTCKTVVAERKKALRAFVSAPSPQNLTNLKILQAKARRILRASKRESWQQYVSSLNTHTPVKKAWDMVRKISGKRPTTSVSHLLVNNTRVTETKDIANTLAQNISTNSSTNNYTYTFQRFKTISEQQPINFRSNNKEYYNVNFSIHELMGALHQAHDTAVGPDEIHYQFLKHLPDSSLVCLLNLFNSVWNGGPFPANWRHATIIPVPKPGKDKTDANNYRPIALTSCLCKTMERMVNRRLVFYLESNDIFTDIQSGFRKQRSTTDQLVRLETWIREGLANRQHVVAVFFDLEKAYDTTWKYGILSDLFRAGLRGNLPIFISQFLENREFKVRIASTLSSQYQQEMGVPQGSILSVTLFGLKINGIAKCLAPGTEGSLFVDDFLACYRSKQMRSIERRLQQGLNNLQRWADENGFKFSASKTVCMHFCNLRRLHQDPVLQLYNTNIPVVKETKFLGLTFDNKLSFIPHMQQLRAKCMKALNLLRVVAHKDWGSDGKMLLKLYHSLVRSKLDYGSIIYGSARKSYTQMLDPIHNLALRLCLGAFRTSPIESLLVEANEPPLAIRRNKLSVQYALRVASNPSNPVFDCTFNPQYEDLFQAKPKTIPTFGIRMKPFLLSMGLTHTSIAAIQLPKTPPWLLHKPTVLFNLHTGNKSTTNPDAFKADFYSLTEKYKHYTRIYTDGSKEGDRVACGVVTGTLVIQNRLPNHSSIYTAELRAILLALDFVESSRDTNFLILSDSLSSLQAVSNSCIDHPMILQIMEKHQTIKDLNKSVLFCWIPSHVGIPGNERADTAAKQALALPISDYQLPFSDYKPVVNFYFRELWQTHWSNVPFNKLLPIKPLIGETKLCGVSKRRDETVLHRARIGHSYLTHSFLLRKEDPPECSSCKCFLTVEHILLHCQSYSSVRVNFFSVNSLHELFNQVPPSNILDFLREINLITKF